MKTTNKEQELNFSFQGIKSGQGYAIIAWVQYNYQLYNPRSKFIMDDDGEIINSNQNPIVYQPCVVSTGLWCSSKDFEKDIIIKKALDLFRVKLQELYNLLLGSKKPSPEIFKNNIKEYIIPSLKSFAKDYKKGLNVVLPEIVLPSYLGPEKDNIPVMLIPFIDYTIEKIKREGYSIHNIKPSTLTVYERFKNRLIDYKNDGGKDLNIQKMDLNQIKEFIIWGQNKNYKYNYLQAFKKEFRQILNKAKAYNIISSINLDDKFFKNSWVKQQDPYFYINELEKLKKIDFEKVDLNLVKKEFNTNISIDVLDQSRDFLLISCACGARFSDLKNIHHIFQDEKRKYYFEYTSQKTGVKSKIPIYDKHIIKLYTKKYKKEFNLKIKEQTYNEAIKAVCMLVGLNRKIISYNLNTHTGKKETETSELWQVVTSKIGRKTMCSLAVKVHQIPLTILCSWSGHTSEYSLKNYIQLSDEDYYKLSQKLAHKIGI